MLQWHDLVHLICRIFLTYCIALELYQYHLIYLVCVEFTYCIALELYQRDFAQD